MSAEPKEIVAQDYQPITDSANVKRFVADYFRDTPILAHIAACESQNRQFDKDGTVLRGVQNSADVGVMQINEKYHADEAKKLGYDIYSLDGNAAFGRYLYEHQGAKPWMSSSPCWSKFSGSEITKR